MFTFRPVSAATRSEPNSGKSSPTNTALTPQEPTTETRTSNLSASTSTTMKPPAANTFPVQSSSILSPAPWTLSDQDPTDRSSDQTTSFLDSLEPETTGPRDITQKVSHSNLISLNSPIFFSSFCDNETTYTKCDNRLKLLSIRLQL